MRELTKSMLRFPWAMSMFGIGQAARMADPATGLRRLSSSFDNVSRVAEDEMDEGARSFYRSGDHFQNGLVDTAFGLMSTPPWDLAGWLRRGQEMTERSLTALGRGLESGRE